MVGLLDSGGLCTVNSQGSFLPCKNVLRQANVQWPLEQHLGIHCVVRLFSPVDSLVDSKLCGPPEPLATLCTKMAFFTHVGFLVPGEVRRPAKLLPTLSTVIGFRPSMNFLVKHEFRLAPEEFSTFHARVAFLPHADPLWAQVLHCSVEFFSKSKMGICSDWGPGTCFGGGAGEKSHRYGF